MIDTTKYKGPIQLTNFVDIYHRSSFLEQQREELVTEVERLQKMVEKMKCCANCKHGEEGIYFYCRKVTAKTGNKYIVSAKYKCEHWEEIV